MANREHLKIFSSGVQEWNIWREQNPLVKPNLSGARLSNKSLYESHPIKPKGPNKAEADIQEIDFSEVNLKKANLQNAVLLGTNLVGANLTGTNLRGAILVATDFTWANLTNTDFTGAKMTHVTFAANDLSVALGLETVFHGGPSYLSTETIYQSGGRIPRPFLEGCGLPEELIDYLPSLITARQAVEFYSCFISYSHKDEAFAKRLYSRMRDANLRVWFAPENVKGGEKLYEQIDRAIHIYDRLLIVLSESSMQSEWVITEIRKARAIEIAENRRMLFPIRLVSFERIQEWTCFDADSGKDLAAVIREYFIPDFSSWKDHDAFEKAFDRLLRDLRAEEQEK